VQGRSNVLCWRVDLAARRRLYFGIRTPGQHLSSQRGELASESKFSRRTDKNSGFSKALRHDFAVRTARINVSFMSACRRHAKRVEVLPRDSTLTLRGAAVRCRASRRRPHGCRSAVGAKGRGAPESVQDESDWRYDTPRTSPEDTREPIRVAHGVS
jgi:hypothetical protein